MDTVLITGTSRGIGKVLEAAFKKRGDRVLAYRRDEIGDIRELATIEKLKVWAESASVNILINNAGVYSDKTIIDATPEEIREIVEVNMIAPMLLTRALWPLLMSQGGTVIFINSVAGRVPAGKEVAYRSSKFGLSGFSSTLFYEGKRDGVRVVDIPLGGVNTDMLKHRPGMDKNPMQQPPEAADLILRILESHSAEEIKHILLQGRIIDNRALQNL